MAKRIISLKILLIAVIAVIAVGCSFTGTTGDPADTTAPPETSGPVEITMPTAATETTAPIHTTAPTETSAPPSPVGTAENPYPAGTYVVGTDITEGTYVFLPNEAAVPGNFESGDVKQDFYGQFFWDLRSGSTVTASNCYFFSADDYTVTQNPDGSYGPGMYRVGIDIPEGGYAITPASSDTPAVWYRFFSISEFPYHNDYYRSESAVYESVYLDAELSWGAILVESGTLTLVEEYIFTPPEPPAAQEVKALPEHFDVSTLVTPYYQIGVDLIGGGTEYISLPTIYPFSDAAVACQQEIYETVLPTMLLYAEESSWTDIRDTKLIPYETIHTARYVAGIGFDAYLYKNTLSIVVWEKNHYGMTNYYVFCLDISTGKRLSQDTMRSRADIGAEDIRQLLEAEFTGKWTGYPYSKEGADELNKLYKQQLRNITSDKNVAKSQVFITNDGSIYVAANVYSLAGASYYPQLLPYKIAGPKTVEEYQALFNDSTEIGYMRQMALTSFYRYPSQMDLFKFFYRDFSKSELSQAEQEFLIGKGFDLRYNVQSFTTAEMESFLQSVCQMPLAHSNKVGLEKFTYYAETDSYYCSHTDTIFPGITVTRFEELGNDIVKLYYTCIQPPRFEDMGKELVATVGITSDGSIRIISNQPSL